MTKRRTTSTGSVLRLITAPERASRQVVGFFQDACFESKRMQGVAASYSIVGRDGAVLTGWTCAPGSGLEAQACARTMEIAARRLAEED